MRTTTHRTVLDWFLTVAATAVVGLGAAVMLPTQTVDAEQVDLGQEVRKAGRDGSEWLVYTIEPAAHAAHRFVCCHQWRGGAPRAATCRPERDDGGWSVSDRTAAHQPGDELLRVYLGVEVGAVQRVRVFSAGCDVELSWPVRELLGVHEDESLDFLRGLAAGESWKDSGSGEARRDRHRHPLDEILAAMAQHRGPAAAEALAGLTEPSRDAKLRREAIFWIGQTRDPLAVETLSRRLDDTESTDLREHILFSLSQVGLPEAVRRIRRAAEQDPSPDVREQGWFWLAQTGDPSAEEAILAALRTERDEDVRHQAVFALSQLPGTRAVDALLQVLQESSDGELQRQALFWLAESDDPRALERISDLLGS